MNHWKKTGKIKAIILGFLALPNLLMPIGAQGQQGIEMILMPLIFGSIAIPLIAKFNQAVLGREIIRPNWNDNPLNLKRPLAFFHFGSFFFLIVGLSVLIGAGVKFQTLSFLGLTLISFGVGISIGHKMRKSTCIKTGANKMYSPMRDLHSGLGFVKLK